MAGRERETAEEKIARIVRETMSGEARRAEEEKDPNKQWLRKALREEFKGALEELFNDAGDRERGEGGEGGDNFLTAILGGRR